MASTALTLKSDADKRAGMTNPLPIQQASVTASDFYRVGGKQRPSAKAFQKFANAQHISSEVLRLDWHERSSFYQATCTAYVRAWIGPKARPKQETTQAVTLSMAGIIQRYAAKNMAKGFWKNDDVEIDAAGRILPKGKKHQLDMLSFLADQFTFLDRSAITKAEIRAFDKLLRPDAVTDEPEYDDGHEPTPPTPTADPVTGEIIDPNQTTIPPEPPPGQKEPDPTPPPQAEGNEGAGVSFPPSEQELKNHQEKADKRGEEPKKSLLDTTTLSRKAKEIIAMIDKAGVYRKTVGDIGKEVGTAKDELEAEEQGLVMQYYWSAYEKAK